MKFLAIAACFLVLAAGALAQQEDADEGNVVVDVPAEAPGCPQELVDLYRNSRNACIDEIRAARSASTAESTIESTTAVTEDIEQDLERCAQDEEDEDEGENDHNQNEDQGNNRPQHSGRNRHQGRRSRGRHTVWSARRKQFFYQFKTCLVDKIKDNSIILELKSACEISCANVSAAKREIKQKKCILKKLKKRCPNIVPEGRPRTQRRLRFRTRSHQRRNN